MIQKLKRETLWLRYLYVKRGTYMNIIMRSIYHYYLLTYSYNYNTSDIDLPLNDHRRPCGIRIFITKSQNLLFLNVTTLHAEVEKDNT